MRTGRRYLLALSPTQEDYAERVAGACRAVWNTGLEQRREYRRRGARITFAEQCRQLTEAKKEHEWLSGVPNACLQQSLKDLDATCRRHGAWKAHWKSRRRSAPAFRFADMACVHVKRVSRRWGQVKLPKFGWLKFRWSRPLGGQLRNVTVLKDGGRWYVSFCVEDGLTEFAPNGKSPVGVDRGVKVAVATSDGLLRDRPFLSPRESARLKRLQQQLARQQKGSNRRADNKAKIGRLHARIRARRTDFVAWTANRLTKDHGLVVVEDLKVRSMTASAKGTIESPGTKVRQKAGLNRSILSKGWGGLLTALEHKARYNGSRIVRVPAAYTSQTCSVCGHCAPENRESQAVFRCRSCGHQANADINAAKNILAAGLAVTGRGDLAIGRSAKRQPGLAGIAAAKQPTAACAVAEVNINDKGRPMPTISPTMLALLRRTSQEDVFAYKVQDEGVREATIFALKDRGLIEFGEFVPGAGKRLVPTTMGRALLSHFAGSSSEER